MQISRQSWHHRFIRYSSIKEPTNLCSYIRAFFQAFPLGVIKAFRKTGGEIGEFLAVLILFSLFFHTLALLLPFGEVSTALTVFAFITFPFLPTVLFIFFIIFGSLVFLCTKLYKKYSSSNKEPGFFLSYLEARKEKICPLIEYKE